MKRARRPLLIITWMLILSALICAAAATEPPVLTTSGSLLRATDTEGYTSGETPLGSFAADTVRAASGADFVILCAGDLGASLEAGDVTLAQLEASFPGGSEVRIVTASVPQIVALLEETVADVVLNDKEQIDREASESPRFPQISGFGFVYDAPALPGTRIKHITEDGDEELALTQDEPRYTLAVSSRALELTGFDGFDDEPRSLGLLTEILAGELAKGGGITEAPAEGRITVTGAYENLLLSSIPMPLLMIAVIVIALFSGVKYRNRYKDER